MDREEVLAIIDAAYAARQADDGAALAPFFAEGATFRIAGEASLLSAFPGVLENGAMPEIGKLMRFIRMSGFTRIESVVEGRRASVIGRATVSFAGREPFETLLYDLWELDETGRVRSLIQFADTAKVVREMQALAGG